MKNLTFQEFENILVKEEYDESVRNQIQGWIARGDAVVVYENHDLGHFLMGLHVLLSYGSEAAQLPAGQYPEIPPFCPVDAPSAGPGWRYVLVGIYDPQDHWPHKEKTS